MILSSSQSVYHRAVVFICTAAATLASIAKSVVYFQFINSDAILIVSVAIFVVCSLYLFLDITRDAARVYIFVLFILLFYAVACINYMALSSEHVPITYLFGLLIFHGLFLVGGFCSGAMPRVMACVLLFASLPYAFALLSVIVDDRELVEEGRFVDVFGLAEAGIASEVEASVLYQNVGQAICLGAIALCTLLPARFQRALSIIVLFGALATTLSIGARTAALSLVACIVLVAAGGLNRRLVVSVMLLGATGMVGFLILDDLAGMLQAIDRTIVERDAPDPDSRMFLYLFAIHGTFASLSATAFGNGLGMFPVYYSGASPDWLIARPDGVIYPHNPFLEVLYETGAVGFIPFSIVIIGVAFCIARNFSKGDQGRQFIALFYIFMLASVSVSGALAYSYPFVFVLGAALRSLALTEAPSR